MKHNWRTITVTTLLSWTMKLILVASCPYLLYKGEYLFFIATLSAIFLSLAPSIIERNYRVTLPFEVDFLVTLLIFLHTFFGEEMKFYDNIWIWDKIMHVYGSALISMLAFMIVYTLHRTKKLKLTLPFIGLFTVTFTIAVGALWEIGEFSVDRLFGLNTQYGLNNTMWDLIDDLAGGSLMAIVAIIYVRFTHPEKRVRLQKPIGEIVRIPSAIRNPSRKNKRK